MLKCSFRIFPWKTSPEDGLALPSKSTFHVIGKRFLKILLLKIASWSRLIVVFTSDLFILSSRNLRWTTFPEDGWLSSLGKYSYSSKHFSRVVNCRFEKFQLGNISSNYNLQKHNSICWKIFPQDGWDL